MGTEITVFHEMVFRYTLCLLHALWESVGGAQQRLRRRQQQLRKRMV